MSGEDSNLKVIFTYSFSTFKVVSILVIYSCIANDCVLLRFTVFLTVCLLRFYFLLFHFDCFLLPLTTS